MLGIENLKTLVLFACDFTKQASEVLADRVFKWTEAASFFDELLRIPAVVRSLPAVVQEWKDLDEAERVELREYVKEHFDLPNDQIEVFIENAFAFGLAAVSMIEQWNAIRRGNSGE